MFPLVMHKNAARKSIDGNGAVKKSVRISDHILQRAKHLPLLESMRTSISPGVSDHLQQQEYTEASRRRATRDESTASTEPARYHVHTGVLCTERAVVATKRAPAPRGANGTTACRDITCCACTWQRTATSWTLSSSIFF